jgi:hypothetical protein
MQVIRHPAVRVQKCAIRRQRARDDHVQEQAIRIILKNLLAVIAAQRDVVEAIGLMDAKGPRHKSSTTAVAALSRSHFFTGIRKSGVSGN